MLLADLGADVIHQIERLGQGILLGSGLHLAMALARTRIVESK